MKNIERCWFTEDYTKPSSFEKNYGQLYLVPFNYVFDPECHLFILLSPADFWLNSSKAYSGNWVSYIFGVTWKRE